MPKKKKFKFKEKGSNISQHYSLYLIENFSPLTIKEKA